MYMKDFLGVLRVWCEFHPIQDNYSIWHSSYFKHVASWIYSQNWLLTLLLMITFNIVFVSSFYFVSSQVPLFGVSQITSQPNCLYWPRVILSSYPGTLLEFGVVHIVFAKLIIKCMEYYTPQSESSEFSEYDIGNLYFSFPVATLAFFGILVSLFAALVSIFLGLFGNPLDLSTENCIAIVTQLVGVGYAMVLLQMLSNKAFATSLDEIILWKAFSPAIVNTGRGNEYQGAVCALFHLLRTRQDKVRGLREAFYRQNLPNLINLLQSFLIFSLITYFRVRSFIGIFKAITFQFIFFGVIQLILNRFIT